MSQVVKLPTRSRALALRCTACGVEADAACGCGVAYEPASVVVARAIEANPTKSNRAIAEIAGVTHTTVNQIRAATGNHFPVDDKSLKTIGLDGKARPMKPKRPKKLVVLETLEPLDYTLQMFTTYVLPWFEQLDDDDRTEFWRRVREETSDV